MIVAGEASGDLHGSRVVRELKRLDPTVEVFGVGGDLMEAEGMTLIYHIRETAVLGIWEVLKHLPLLLSLMKTLERLLYAKKPDVVCLIDYPGFNLRFAKKAKKAGVKTVYYIAPQVWAWKKSRVTTMRETLDKVLVILPFEEAFFQKENIRAQFVGHPLVEEMGVRMDRNEFCKTYGIDAGKKILAILPGSRLQEIEQILPEALAGARNIALEKNMELVLGVAPTLEEKYFRTMYETDGVHVVKGATYETMKYAHFAIVTSGTATLETALFGTPMVILYKASFITYAVAKMLVKLKYIGLVNIIANDAVVPELLQYDLTAANIYRKVMEILEDGEQRNAMKRKFAGLRSLLGRSGASRLVAEHLLSI
jgi:lipid-A-disaccharide synthase